MQGLKQKLIVSGLGLGLLAGGAAGLVLGTSGVSGAQETTTTTTVADAPAETPAEDSEPPATDDTKPDEKPADAPDDKADENPADAPEEKSGEKPAEGERPEGTEHPSSEDRQQRHRDKLAETLAPLVAAGTIDQAQADAVIDAMLAAQAERGPGKGGFEGKGGRGGHGRGFGSEAAAAALGITTDELREALGNGSTLAEISEDKGVDRQVLIDALTKEAKERVVAKVADGSLTQEQADQKLAKIDERAAAQIDGTRG